MAKKPVNKSQAIRDALQANPGNSPSEIAEGLKAKGLKVNAQYVSTIKSNMKGKAKKSVVRRKKPGPARNGLGPFAAALKFIHEAGGLASAKQCSGPWSRSARSSGSRRGPSDPVARRVDACGCRFGH